MFFFFVGPLFEQVDGRTVHFSEKSRSKTGTCTGFCRGSDLFSVLAPPIEFGRWHSPQVAPAAPPAPRVHSSFYLVLNLLVEKTVAGLRPADTVRNLLLRLYLTVPT